MESKEYSEEEDDELFGAKEDGSSSESKFDGGYPGDSTPLLQCIDALEDLLLSDIMPEDVYLGDDDDGDGDDSDGDGGGGGGGPAQALFRQCRLVLKSSLPDFVEAVEAGKGSGECSLSFSSHHRKFAGTIEKHLEECIAYFGFETLDAFVREVRGMLELGGGDESDSKSPDADDVMKFATARELLDVIECVNKFENFAEGMRIKAVMYLEHLREGKPDDDAWSYGRRR